MGACWQFVKSFTPVPNAFKEKVINGAISITSNFTSSRNTTEAPALTSDIPQRIGGENRRIKSDEYMVPKSARAKNEN